MFYLITGGAASGKSEYAENLCLKLSGENQSGENQSGERISIKKQPGKMLYIATMKPFGEEALKKIERHRKMRKSKGFETLEKYNLLSEADTSGFDTVLLECMSNLLANEFFESENYFDNIVKGIDKILETNKNLVLITNKIFSDGVRYDNSTMKYMEAFGSINRCMAAKSDRFIEVICGIPVAIKGEI